ncbi:MAG: hypothetical protein VW362_00310, partial [Candidatus Nanopelagicales bacterium]
LVHHGHGQVGGLDALSSEAAKPSDGYFCGEVTFQWLPEWVEVRGVQLKVERSLGFHPMKSSRTTD